jgi:hypothetical protein
LTEDKRELRLGVLIVDGDFGFVVKRGGSDRGFRGFHGWEIRGKHRSGSKIRDAVEVVPPGVETSNNCFSGSAVVFAGLASPEADFEAGWVRRKIGLVREQVEVAGFRFGSCFHGFHGYFE